MQLVDAQTQHYGKNKDLHKLCLIVDKKTHKEKVQGL